ncbi:MAG: glycosyltransferase family 39 protein [Sedimentisphaerales bacterium]|nr:glycosyltransferase family 39 protein [Sedimentisphaerales bacterium]
MSQRNVNLAVVVAAVGLAASILANSMSKPVGRDEQMYCTAGVLMSQGKMIYRDFSYAAQPPYHALLLATVYRVSGTSCYLLAGRLVSIVCDILVVVCILGIYRRVFDRFAVSGGLLGLAGAALYVFNPLVDYSNGYAWNHDVVILFVAAAFWLYISIDFTRRLQWARIAAVGALLTFASCMRITTALVEMLFLAILIGRPAGSFKERCRRMLPFLGAAAVVLIWPVRVVAHAPQAFFLNMIKIPMLYADWLAKIGMVHNKLDLTVACLITPGYSVLVGMAVYLGLAVLFLRPRLKITNGRNLLLASLLAVAFFIIAFVPPTMWRQYLAAPAPFMIIALAYPLLFLRELAETDKAARQFEIVCVLIGLCVLVAAVSNSIVLKRLPLAILPEEWTPVVRHRISEKLGQAVQQPKKVLTLAPLLALEGGCDIYDELSAGSIIYRIGDSLTPDERAATHTVGPQGLRAMVEASPASAAILGVEAPYMAFLEEPLKQIVPPDWKTTVLADGAIAYLRP